MVQTLLTFGERHRWITLMLLVALTALAAGGVSRLRIDTSYQRLISEDAPGWPDYHRTVAEFGSDNTTIIYLKADNIWTPERLRLIEDLVIALEDLEPVESIDSLFGALNIRDKDGILDAGPLMDIAPEDPEEIAPIQADALYSPLIRGNLLSADGRVTAVNVTVERDRRDPEFNRTFYERIEALLAPLRDEFDEVFQIGPPRLDVEIERGIFTDLQAMSPVAALILVATIIAFLRTGWAAVIPITTSLVSIWWTFGFMGYVGIPLTLLTNIVPTLVIVIGSTEDTHMLAAYLHGITAHADRDRRRAIRYMARSVGLPLFLTSFTTAVGFLSNAINDIPLIQQFAYATSFAMVANFLATLLCVPLMLGIAGPRTSRLATEGEPSGGLIGSLQRALNHIGDRHSAKVVTVTAVLVLVFGAAATQVRVSNDPLSYFRSRNPLVIDANTVQRDLVGMQIFYLTLNSEHPGIFRTPQGLKQVQAAQRFMGEQGVFDKTLSLADYMALIHREMNQGDEAFHQVPDTQGEIEEYLLLLSRTDVERYVDPDYRRANIVVRHNLSDSQELNTHLDQLTAMLEATLEPEIGFTLTGENLMINRAAESLFAGQIKSLALLMIIITLIVGVLYTSVLAGLLSLIPNLIPVVFNFGVMALAGVPLNPGTATVAAVAVGIAIDDTIHLMTRYEREARNTVDQAAAVRATLAAEAVPVIATSVALALGFSVLLFSEFLVVAQYGMLAAMTMIYALLADLLVTPILLRKLRLVGMWEILGLVVDRAVVVGCPLFRAMSPYQIKKAILLSQLHTFEAGEAIIEQGATTRSLYVILSGEVEVVRAQAGATRRLATLGPGDVIGEVAYASEIERTATVRATRTTTVMTLDHESTERALRFHPRVAARLNGNIGRLLSERFARHPSAGEFPEQAP